MNTLSKVAIAFALICSLVAYAKWEKQEASTVGLAARFDTNGNWPSPVSVTTSADGKTVYYAHSLGLFKSTDGGETWSQLRQPPRVVHPISYGLELERGPPVQALQVLRDDLRRHEDSGTLVGTYAQGRRAEGAMYSRQGPLHAPTVAQLRPSFRRPRRPVKFE